MIFARSAALTHPGRKRPKNEDYVTYFEPVDEEELRQSGYIYILADGVGGASKGERASQFAAQKILHDYYQYPEMLPEQRLKMIIRRAGNEIFEFAEQQENFMRMATTVVVAIIRNGYLRVAHVGDSRAYLIQDGQISLLTRDHSTIGEMMRDGLLTEEEAMHYNGRNLLSRSLGGQLDVKVDVTKEIKFNPGDKLLLVSDGLSRYATQDQILDLLTEDPPEIVVTNMVDYANQQGGVDNVSIILVEGLQEQDLTRAMPMGQQPEPVDWETLPTEPSIYTYRKAKRTKLKKQHFIFGLGLILILVVAGIVLTRKGIIDFFSPEPTLAPFAVEISANQTRAVLNRDSEERPILNATEALADSEFPSPETTQAPKSETDVTDTPTITPTVTPHVIINASLLNCRKGDSEAYDIVSQIGNGKTAKVIARNLDATWYFIENTEGDENCWVSGNPDLVELVGIEKEDLQIKDSPSPPTPTDPPPPTREPTPLPTREPTPSPTPEPTPSLTPRDETSTSHLPNYLDREFVEHALGIQAMSHNAKPNGTTPVIMPPLARVNHMMQPSEPDNALVGLFASIIHPEPLVPVVTKPCICNFYYPRQQFWG
jgi:PPM family protein phosphatase